jgi:hypothetical protein
MNRVTTKHTANWFELFEPRTSLRAPTVRSAPGNIIWMRQAAPSRLRLRPAAISGNYRVGDGWETLTYTVLWLCALVVIALCWV